MSLTTYKNKRKFSETPEPKPKKKQAGQTLKFVIQKHAASHLHYDFRLELDGVLKSWAVPKGPSLDPSIKRLAIQVEDHPYDYGSFEGTIPKGNYGAGQVIIWDHGTYTVSDGSKQEQENLIREQLEKGDLKFTLNGKKLKGRFALVKIRSEPSGKQWLLIKKSDEFQSTEDITKLGESVVSGHEILSGYEEEAPKSAMPHHVKPMLAYLVEEPFNKKDWIYEIKWDGYRAVAEITNSRVVLYSRNFLSFNESFPAMVSCLEQLPGKMVLDGELIVLDKQGRSRFQLLQNYLNDKNNEANLRYCVFDILYYEGRDLRDLPLLERKQILHQVLSKANLPCIIYSDHVEEEGIEFFQKAVKEGLEGVIAKDGQSRYVSTRSRSWLKIKAHQEQEVIICGFTKPRGGRKHIGALVAGVHKDGKLEYAGHVGGGLDSRMLKQLYELLEPIVIKESPFAHKVKTNMPVTWVKPKYVCQVGYQELTDEGIMRIPVFKGMREDKPPEKVVLEEPIDPPPAKEKNRLHKHTKGHKSLEEIGSNLEKIFWPEEKITKGDLLRYYEAIAPVMLPHLKDRPIVMHRYPNGIADDGFYNKDAPSFIPDWIHTVKVEHSEKTISYILIENVESLLYVVNLASIEIHPFLSRYTNLDDPDFLVLDIDPGKLTFEHVIDASKEVHKILESLKLPHSFKTSGKRGMHIYIPLHAKYHYEDVENFAKLLANVIHEILPETTSVTRDPKKREDKIYLDYLQNSPTKMVVAPYSVRAIEGARVSTPIDVKELRKGLDPRQFTIKTVPGRVQKKGDLFQAVFGAGIDFAKVIKALEKLR